MSTIALFLTGMIATGPALFPTSPWNVNYAQDSCEVGRAYGSPDKPLMLGIKADTIGRGVSIILVDGSTRGTFDERKLRVQFSPDVKADTVEALLVSVGPKGNLKVIFPLNESAVQRMVQASRLSVNIRNGTPVTFETPDIVAALAALEKCKIDLLSAWGMSAAEQSRLKVPAKARFTRLFTQSDYPTTAIKAREQGTVRVRFVVDAVGQPSECAITYSSGSGALDEATCRIIKERARYDPALDLDGKPMRAIDTAAINWVLP